MGESHCYRVGGHLFALDSPSPGLLSEKELINYAPFRAVPREGEEMLFTLAVTDCRNNNVAENDRIARFTDENGCMELFRTPAGNMEVILSTTIGYDCARINIQQGFRNGTAYISGRPEERRYALDTALMLLYAFASAPFATLLFHASVVEYDGRGYLFLGKSGTGKSTHSRLWIENIPGTRLLNDDNPVIRITAGVVRVYGSPWSGKTSCHLNRDLPVGAFVRLSQARCNEISLLPAVRAYAALLPSCSYMRWDSVMAASIHHTLSLIVGRVNVYSMACRPDREAALLCKETVS